MPIAGYSGTPLVRKLGIKPATSLALLSAPAGFARELVGLPGDVRVSTRAGGRPDLIVWFVGSQKALEARVEPISALVNAPGRGLWIAWPKKASGLATDLTENSIRDAGLAHGLVDYKVCAINETWSGLKFARRKKG
jgi:hypothetical protein